MVFSFSTAALVDSLLDGLVIGGILAIILVALRGPLALPTLEGDKHDKRKRRPKKTEPAVARRAGLGDYLTAWAMLGVVAASASYAVATGHGAYGLITSAVKGFRAVPDPARLALMAILDVAFFAAMGAALWTGIWWIARFLLRLIRRSWAERTKLIHGTIFGLVVGGLLGFSVCFTEAIAGRIVGPLELLRSAKSPPAYDVGYQALEGRDAGQLC